MGSNKVLRVALGVDAATEYRTNLAQLAERVRGSTGLFFTKLPREQASGRARRFEGPLCAEAAVAAAALQLHCMLARRLSLHVTVWRCCAEGKQSLYPHSNIT